MRTLIIMGTVLLVLLTFSSCSSPTDTNVTGNGKESSPELNLSVTQVEEGQQVLPSVSIDFSLPVGGEYRLVISGITGYEVALFEGYSDAGSTTIEWDASALESGYYMYELFAGEIYAMKTVLLCIDRDCGGIDW